MLLNLVVSVFIFFSFILLTLFLILIDKCFLCLKEINIEK